MPILPKGIQDGIDKAGKGVGKLFGKKEKPEHPMKGHNAAQERVNKMRAVLETIEFEEGQISPEDVEKYGLHETKDALVYALSDPNITKDDMTKIDEILMFACDSLAESVKKGRVNVADWSCIALSVGLSQIRSDIPPSEAGDETERKKQIQARSLSSTPSRNMTTRRRPSATSAPCATRASASTTRCSRPARPRSRRPRDRGPSWICSKTSATPATCPT